MLFRDTGQFVYEVVTDDVYEGFYKDRGLFDFSNYPRDSKFFDPINKKVIGKMKEWHAGMTRKFVKRSKFFTPNFGLMVSAVGCNCKRPSSFNYLVEIAYHQEKQGILLQFKLCPSNTPKKDEFKGEIISGFAGLKSKVKAKGTNRKVAENKKTWKICLCFV